jgi:hypothetical protein
VILIARTLARLVGFLLLVALSLLGLAAAVFAIQGGDATLSYPQLAEWLGLPELRDEVGTLYERLEADGPVAIVSLLAGLAAVLVGLTLVVGALAPRREREATLEQSDEGRISARRRPLARAAEVLARRAGGVGDVKARVLPSWRGGGRLRVRADLTRKAAEDPGAVRREVEQSITPLTGPFELRCKISTRAGEGRSRVR